MKIQEIKEKYLGDAVKVRTPEQKMKRADKLLSDPKIVGTRYGKNSSQQGRNWGRLMKYKMKLSEENEKKFLVTAEIVMEGFSKENVKRTAEIELAYCNPRKITIKELK